MERMNKIIRRQFLGNWILFSALRVSLIGISIAILYYKEGMVIVEEELDDPGAFLEAYRAGKLRG
jgi:hypothetical protein